jgi:hypothetical protein
LAWFGPGIATRSGLSFYDTIRGKTKRRVQPTGRSVFHVVSHLPANAAAPAQNPNALSNDFPLLRDVVIEMEPLFVFLAQVVGRRSDNQLDGSRWDLAEHFAAVAFKDDGLRSRLEPRSDVESVVHFDGVYVN